MFKKYAKKLLATAVVAMLLVTCIPSGFALEISKFSDFGLGEALTIVDNSTQKDGKTLPDTYSKPGFKNEPATGNYWVSIYGFNRGDDVKGRYGDAISCYDTDDGGTDFNSTNMVAKLPGHETPEGFAHTSSGVGVSYKETGAGTSKTIKGNLTSDYQLWEVKVKLSQTTVGEVRLFSWSTDSSHHFGGQRSNDTMQATIGIKGGKIYTVADDYEPVANDGTELTEVVAEINAKQWYNIVRVIKIDRTEKIVYNKLYVFDSTGACIGGHDDWRKAGTIKNSTDVIISHGFAQRDIPLNEYLLLDDHKGHNLTANAPTVTVDDSDVTDTVTVSAARPQVKLTLSSGLSGDAHSVVFKDGENDIPCKVETVSNVITVTPEVDLYPGATYTVGLVNALNRFGIAIPDTTIAVSKEADKLTVSDAGFVGSDGATPVTQITEGQVIKASVTLSNADTEARDAVALLTVYDGNKLIGAKALTFTNIPTDSTPQTLTTEAVTVPALKNTAKAYITVWSDWMSKIPLKTVTVLGN